MSAETNPDVEVVRSGYSMVVLIPISETGRQWIDENLQTEGWQWMGGSLGIDIRYAPAIVEGMQEDGLEVRT